MTGLTTVELTKLVLNSPRRQAAEKSPGTESQALKAPHVVISPGALSEWFSGSPGQR